MFAKHNPKLADQPAGITKEQYIEVIFLHNRLNKAPGSP